MAKQFEAEHDSLRYSNSGEGFKLTGTMDEVIEAAVKDSKEEDAHLVPMASDILRDQLERLPVGESRMFNWACTVLNIKVKRVS